MEILAYAFVVFSILAVIACVISEHVDPNP